MRTTHLFLWLIFVTNTVLFSQNDTLIIWQSNVQITWDYFKGLPRNDLKYAALISSGIYFQHNDYGNNLCFVTKLYACIYPYNSSYKMKSENVLRHEQTHFNISEYFARLFRKRISALVDENGCLPCDTLLSIHSEMIDSLNSFQNIYDMETSFSTNISKQEEWDEKVKKLIEDLDEWAEPIDFE